MVVASGHGDAPHAGDDRHKRIGRLLRDFTANPVAETLMPLRRPAAGGRADQGDRPCPRPRYSWTSSINVPNEVLGWMKATVVPREPGRGASSMTRPPASLIDCSAAAQSATRYPM
jgi:hypothetical protein